MTEEEREAMSSDDELSRMLEAELDGTEGDHSKLNSEMAIPPERPNKRKREGDTEQSGESCPPHPGSIHGICFRCGQPIAGQQTTASLAIRYIHQGLQLSEAEAVRIRNEGLQKILSMKKLILVLDLDHTLLNTTGASEIEPELEERLMQMVGRQHGQVDQSLYRFHNMWTKLRPSVREFLEAAQELAELYVYTHGGRDYAKAMAKLLDPTGKYFGRRVISQGDSTKKHVKDLDVMLGAESVVLILDDTPGMWPQHKRNLIQVERYIYFPADAKRLGAAHCLLEAQRDESAEDGQLSVALNCLKSLHAKFYSENEKHFKDVRGHLTSMRGSILAGVVICFTAIIPLNAPYKADESPVYQLACQLGARIESDLSSEVTHVVAGSPGTEKAKRALQKGLFVVAIDWLVASGFLWRRLDERQFPAKQTAGHEMRSEKEDAAMAVKAAGGGLCPESIDKGETPL